MDPARVSNVERRLGQALPAGIGQSLTKRRQLITSNLRPDGHANLVRHGNIP